MEPTTVNPFPNLSFVSLYGRSPQLDAAGNLTGWIPWTMPTYRALLPGDIGLDFAYVPGGMFSMGTMPGLGYEDERPQHLVRVDPFLISLNLVSQRQWQAVMRKLPPVRFRGDDQPVTVVSWVDARYFCKKSTRFTGHQYALPSEAQWEYACRAGSQAPFSTGATITTAYANYCGDHVYAQEPRGVYRHTTTQPGTFPANPFGIQDMHGNLWEWCSDLWHPDYTGAPFFGKPWLEGGEGGWRVARGGSWHEPPGNCRSATRLRLHEDDKEDVFGFRVVINP